MSALHGVDGHAYLKHPMSRTGAGEGCPQCGQGGGPPTVQQRSGDVWPDRTAYGSHGLCGDPFQGRPITALSAEPHMVAAGAPTATYTAGSIVSLAVDVVAHHKGHFEFRICDFQLDASLGSHQEGQECLDKRVLQRVPPEEAYGDCVVNDARPDCQPIDVNNPGRWYVPPPTNGVKVAGAHWSDSEVTGYTGSFNGVGYQMRYRIPADLSCTHCTLQWYWATANSCFYDGDYFTYFQHIEDLGWSSNLWAPHAVSSWANCGNQCCRAGTFAEEFWGCADVAVVAGGPTPPPTPQPPTSAPAATTQPEPEPEAEPATPAPATPAPTAEPEPEPEPATAAPATPATPSTGECADSAFTEPGWTHWTGQCSAFGIGDCAHTPVKNACCMCGGGSSLSQTKVGKVQTHRFLGAKSSSMMEEWAERDIHDEPLFETPGPQDEL